MDVFPFALSRDYIATILLTSTRLASSPGKAWQFPKMIRMVLWQDWYPRKKMLTELSGPPRGGSVSFFSVVEILFSFMSIEFLKTAMPHREGPPQCIRDACPHSRS